MGSLAGMLQARGHRVTGSDVNVYPPMSTMLESLGIAVRQGYSAENLSPTPDCVVVGNAIPRGNPEVEEALNKKLLIIGRNLKSSKKSSSGGRRFSGDFRPPTAKTTTTSIAAWVMTVGGLDPGFLVGGVVQNFGSSFKVTNSPYFSD